MSFLIRSSQPRSTKVDIQGGPKSEATLADSWHLKKPRFWFVPLGLTEKKYIGNFNQSNNQSIDRSIDLLKANDTKIDYFAMLNIK